MITKKNILKEYKINITFEAPQHPPLLSFNKFYWWRRYPSPSFLHKYQPISMQIDHGDFDYSPYAFQVQYEYQWLAEEIAKLRNSNQSLEVINEKERKLQTIYNKRIYKLQDDFIRDENDRISRFKKTLIMFYGGCKEKVDYFIENIAEGTLIEVTKQYKEWIKR
jgi:hypothetical protein